MLLNNLTGDECLSAGAGDVMDEWPWVCRTPENSLKVEGWENYIHMSYLGQAHRQAGDRRAQDYLYINMNPTVPLNSHRAKHAVEHSCKDRHNKPTDHGFQNGTPPPLQPILSCVSLFPGSPWSSWKPWFAWTSWKEGMTTFVLFYDKYFFHALSSFYKSQ